MSHASSDADQYMIAADLTLYSNPLNRVLGNAITMQKERAKLKGNKDEDEEKDLIASDMVKYDSPLDDLERESRQNFGKTEAANNYSEQPKYADLFNKTAQPSSTKEHSSEKSTKSSQSTTSNDCVSKTVKDVQVYTHPVDPMFTKVCRDHSNRKHATSDKS